MIEVRVEMRVALPRLLIAEHRPSAYAVQLCIPALGRLLRCFGEPKAAGINEIILLFQIENRCEFIEHITIPANAHIGISRQLRLKSKQPARVRLLQADGIGRIFFDCFGNRADAEDVMQTALLRLLESDTAFESEAHIPGQVRTEGHLAGENLHLRRRRIIRNLWKDAIRNFDKPTRHNRQQRAKGQDQGDNLIHHEFQQCLHDCLPSFLPLGCVIRLYFINTSA